RRAAALSANLEERMMDAKTAPTPAQLRNRPVYRDAFPNSPPPRRGARVGYEPAKRPMIPIVGRKSDAKGSAFTYRSPSRRLAEACGGPCLGTMRIVITQTSMNTSANMQTANAAVAPNMLNNA